MSGNERYRVNSTRYMIRRAIPTLNLSLQSKQLLKVGCLILSSHIRFVRVVIDSMSVNFHNTLDMVLRLIGPSKDPQNCP